MNYYNISEKQKKIQSETFKLFVLVHCCREVILVIQVSTRFYYFQTLNTPACNSRGTKEMAVLDYLANCTEECSNIGHIYIVPDQRRAAGHENIHGAE